MQGEHCLSTSNTVHSSVHAQVRREGERFLRFSNLLLLIFKLPNIDKDQLALKHSLLSVRSFFLQDVFPAYTLSTGTDELFVWLQSFFKEIELIQCMDLLKQWQDWYEQIKRLLDNAFDQFISTIWENLQSSQAFTMHVCYKQWLTICDDSLQQISQILLNIMNTRRVDNDH